MAELRIPIIGEFKGKKAFDQAGKSTSSLEKGVKRLGGALAATFGAQQVLKFAKNAAKAFIEDEQAATRLAQSVKNLGLAFETPRIEEFISQLSRASGVTDDQLRPAMQKLLQTTGSVAKSTELLTQALDISRGSGVDYETVVNDLSLAYVGQTRGLKKYSLGLSQAELKTMSFADVQAKLADQFKGANSAYLETYAGKLSILSTAAGEASEIIGKSLVDSLSILAGDGNTVQPLADAMTDLAVATSEVISGLSVMITKFKELPGVSEWINLYYNKILPAQYKPFLDIINFVRGQAPTPGMGGYPSSALGPGYVDPNAAARKAAEEAAAKRAKELAALQKKALDTQKKALALQKASKTLNLDAIGIEAALKGKISETDRISLLLQKAILEGNATLATQLADQLEAATKRQNELRALLLTTPEAPNPYRNWTLPTDLLNYTAASLGVSVAQLQSAPVAVSSSFSDAQMELMAAVNSFQRADQQAINIEVYLDGDAVGGAITNSQINSSLSGSFNQVSRGNNKGAVAL
jgi:hypothetical protein